MKTLIATLRIGDSPLRIFQDEAGYFEIINFYNRPLAEMIDTFDSAVKQACTLAGILIYVK